LTYSQFALVPDSFTKGGHDLRVELVLTDVEVFQFLKVLQIAQEHTDGVLVFDAVVLEGKARELLHLCEVFSGLNGGVSCELFVADRELVLGFNSYNFRGSYRLLDFAFI